MAGPIRIFVGCAPNTDDAESQAVLEWSIRRHASRPVEITWMALSRDPASPFYSDGDKGWQTDRWATPFSGFRWSVPHLAGAGRAIYLDSDFIVLADVAELIDQPIPAPAVVLGRGDGWRLCCSVWGCERAAAHLPALAELQRNPDSHRAMAQRFGCPPLAAAFAGDWNNLDGRDGKAISDIQALHYTDMRVQPQLRYAIPRLAEQGRRHWFDGQTGLHPRADVIDLFDATLHDAKLNGYPPERYMETPLFGEYRKRSFAA